MDFFLRHWEYSAFALVTGGLLAWTFVRDRFSKLKSIGPAQVTRLINSNDAVLLDVRETAEYEGGRLPNAIHIPLSQLASRSGELAKYAKRPVVVYCERGQRSASTGGALESAGFTELYQLDGGVRAWKEAGLPIEKSR